MPPEKHALLGASKAHQWLACPPSAKFEQQFQDPGPSEAAQEGTLAHALAEDHLRKMLAGKKVTTQKKFREDPLYKPAMEEHVAAYCEVILDTVTTLKLKGADPLVSIEQKIDLSNWIPQGFGTADCVVVGNGILHVFDFKYGKGVPVGAEENPQLKLYGLGAVKEFSLLYDISEVVLHIIQPRLGSITEWNVSREALEKWGRFVVTPIAKEAFVGRGEFSPGEEQCRWCRAKDACRAYNAYMLSLCKARFDDQGEERNPNELSPKEITDLLVNVGAIKSWANRVQEYAQDQAINHGVVWPGFKLVEGQSRRKITDEPEVINILDNAGFTTDKTCRLIGITDLEELVGKKQLQDLIGDHIVKPQGKPTLVPESDKRPVFNDIKFTEVTE